MKPAYIMKLFYKISRINHQRYTNHRYKAQLNKKVCIKIVKKWYVKTFFLEKQHVKTFNTESYVTFIKDNFLNIASKSVIILTRVIEIHYK